MLVSSDMLVEVKDRFRRRLSKYTRRAFSLLPKLENPRILDVGCGSGVPTMELAKLSGGVIVGVDVDQRLLDVLSRKAVEAGVSSRVETVNQSLFALDFPPESFDVIWAEGALWIIGFVRGLREWRRLLKPGGFLVAHEAVSKVEPHLEEAASCGYRLQHSFKLPEDAWWKEFYQPFEACIKKLHARHKHTPNIVKTLKKYQSEADMVRSNPEENRSAFYILRKTVTYKPHNTYKML